MNQPDHSSSSENDPTRELGMRLQQLGTAQTRVYQVVDRLRLVQVTEANMDYEHEAGVVNYKFVENAVDSLKHEDQRALDTDRLVVPSPGAIRPALANVLWIADRGNEGFSRQRYVVGEARLPGSKDESFTQLLLAGMQGYQPLCVVNVNSVQWDRIKQAEETAGLVPSEADLRAAYDPRCGNYGITKHVPSALVPRLGHYTLNPRRIHVLSGTTKERKLAKFDFAYEHGAELQEHLYPADFDRFRVLDHLIKLAGIFEKTPELDQLIAERASNYPKPPYERLANEPDVVATIEAGESVAAIESRIDRLNLSSPE